jgi:hypothetical protein
MWRRAIVLGLLIAGLAAAPAHAGWRPGKARAIRYIDTREGSVSFAVIGPHGGRYSYRGQTVVASASVLKVMFMDAYLRQASVRDRKLNATDRDLLGPMIKRSDNDRATRIANMLGEGPMYRLARRAEMDHFRYTRPWGLSSVTATEQARYMFRLEDYLPRRHEDYARYLLSHVVPRQRWGIGQLERPNWRFYFKGGWGSGTGAVCHQVAFIERSGIRIAAAVMITSSPSHDYAKQTLKGVFKRLLRNLPKPR